MCIRDRVSTQSTWGSSKKDISSGEDLFSSEKVTGHRMGDLNLPKATLSAFIKEVVNDEGLKITPEFTNLIIEISRDYIHTIAGEANRVCLEEDKKTISHDFVFKALTNLKLMDHIEELKLYQESCSKEIKIKGKSKSRETEENEEEMREEQRKLLESIRDQQIQKEIASKCRIYLEIFANLCV
eukprot:TRINITY_DN4128_c0_g1_i4.p1 TRINITY_DN4128_c0_g1~~TRINITY_DN4128_c0_g1_i4.p1  ORF type:complete len:204 (+),score=49.26 TRINITY_DN4128_c0_g1_i4:61-612(+)